MDKSQTKKYSTPLDNRTEKFAERIITMAKAIPKNNINDILIRQCVRSGTSVGANYLEANDALSKKDFLHRMRITRKEAKENLYWLRQIVHANSEYNERIQPLIQENIELIKIFSAIIENSVKKQNIDSKNLITKKFNYF